MTHKEMLPPDCIVQTFRAFRGTHASTRACRVTVCSVLWTTGRKPVCLFSGLQQLTHSLHAPYARPELVWSGALDMTFAIRGSRFEGDAAGMGTAQVRHERCDARGCMAELSYKGTPALTVAPSEPKFWICHVFGVRKFKFELGPTNSHSLMPSVHGVHGRRRYDMVRPVAYLFWRQNKQNSN